MNRVASELLRKVGISKNIPPTDAHRVALRGANGRPWPSPAPCISTAILIILDEPTNNLGVAETSAS